MFPNFLIGLREGLEASLVVGILIAYVVRTGHARRLRLVWTGIAAAVVLSLGFGALLTFTSTTLLSTTAAKETFGGVLSLVAVTFVTWMIFWMRRAARTLKGELQDKLEAALAMGSAALVATAFAAVGREGLETALFLWTNIQSTGTSLAPIIGGTLGLLAAVVLGYLLYKRAVSLNLKTFFTWTGAGLVLVAAGVLAYGIHDLQEGGVLPGLDSLAFDISRIIPPASWYGTLLKGVLNVSPASTWLQVSAYLGYLVPVLVLFFRAPAAPRSGSAPGPASSRAVRPPAGTRAA